MLLYLIRHAHALPAAEDAERPLSPKGRAQMRRLAKQLALGPAFQPGELWHSPLARSRQTARLLAKQLALAAPIHEIAGLEPEANPRPTATRVRVSRHDVAIVGHEPHLSALATLLVTGEAAPVIFKLKKSAVLALELTADARWIVRWQLTPELCGE
jgi:phosphohistidine phosphatase